MTVDNEELLLRPGMTATANIIVEEIKDALLVPNSALRYTPPRESASRGGGLMSLFRPPRMGRSQNRDAGPAATAKERSGCCATTIRSPSPSKPVPPTASIPW